jgi:two-component system response regulator (stage 0 sporulation protein F)
VATILIIDDESMLNMMLSGVLISEGYQVHTATNGPDGLKIIDKEKPDIALVDLKMPGMDGQEVLKEIKKKRGRNRSYNYYGLL